METAVLARLPRAPAGTHRCPTARSGAAGKCWPGGRAARPPSSTSHPWGCSPARAPGPSPPPPPAPPAPQRPPLLAFAVWGAREAPGSSGRGQPGGAATGAARREGTGARLSCRCGAWLGRPACPHARRRLRAAPRLRAAAAAARVAAAAPAPPPPLALGLQLRRPPARLLLLLPLLPSASSVWGGAAGLRNAIAALPALTNQQGASNACAALGDTASASPAPPAPPPTRPPPPAAPAAGRAPLGVSSLAGAASARGSSRSASFSSRSPVRPLGRPAVSPGAAARPDSFPAQARSRSPGIAERAQGSLPESWCRTPSASTPILATQWRNTGHKRPLVAPRLASWWPRLWSGECHSPTGLGTAGVEHALAFPVNPTPPPSELEMTPTSLSFGC